MHIRNLCAAHKHIREMMPEIGVATKLPLNFSDYAAVREAVLGPSRRILRWNFMSASLIGHLGSSTFRPSTTTAVSMSLTGSCFSSESAPGPFHYGIRGRGGTVFRAALPLK